MSKFGTFRRKHEVSESCQQKYESSFIFEGTGSAVIHHFRPNRNKKAAIILTDKEGPDISIIFTLKENKEDINLQKGDYYSWEDKIYFVYENVDLVREANFIKQKSYQCNVQFEVAGKTYYGYFVSSLQRYADTLLQKNIVISDTDKPVLILPHSDWICKDKKIVIGKKPYRIVSYDDMTNAGIVYASLDRDFISDEGDPAVDVNRVRAGDEVTVAICNGYFDTDFEVEIIDLSLDSVTFRMPFGIDKIKVFSRDEEGNSVVKEVEVTL